MPTMHIQRTTYTVADFISWQRSGELEISPRFQRRSVWKPKAKSYLIDTIVKGLPVPILFLRQRTNAQTLKTIKEVVDGQQRLRTVFAYVAPGLLGDDQEESFLVYKTHNHEISGKAFEQLPTNVKQQILDYQFSVHVLPSTTDDADVLKIFARINSSGTKLNDQELRNAEFFGEFKTAAYDAAFEQLDRWRNWQLFDDDQLARMLEVELTSELFMLIMSGPQQKTQKNITTTYQDNDEDFARAEFVKARFSWVLDEIDGKLGNEMPALVFNRIPLFYALFGAVLELGYGESKTVRRGRPVSSKWAKWIQTANERIRNQTAAKTVLEAIARRTTHRSSREEIIRYLTSIK